MKTRKHVGTSVVLCALTSFAVAGQSLAAPIESANLLTNGSFEEGFGGWTGHVALVEQIHDASGVFGTPPDGESYLFIGRSTPYSGWTSNVTRPTELLTIGQEYTVSAYYKNWDEIDSLNVTLQVGSQVVATLPVTSTSGQWAYVEGTYAANEADGVTPTFQIRITGTQSRQLNLGIDGLSVQAIPEPASVGVMAVGMLAAMRRRRRC